MAGECMAGLHEVVVTKKTIDAIKEASKANRSLWRVSSTVSEPNFTLFMPYDVDYLTVSEFKYMFVLVVVFGYSVGCYNETFGTLCAIASC